MEAVLFLLTVLLVGWFVTGPLRDREQLAGEDAELVALRAARDAKLRELRDAELDFATGKLAREDYELIDAGLRAEAATLLRRLDDVAGEHA
jgi:hypothetical protein